jgi:hypothetical protein
LKIEGLVVLGAIVLDILGILDGTLLGRLVFGIKVTLIVGMSELGDNDGRKVEDTDGIWEGPLDGILVLKIVGFTVFE